LVFVILFYSLKFIPFFLSEKNGCLLILIKYILNKLVENEKNLYGLK